LRVAPLVAALSQWADHGSGDLITSRFWIGRAWREASRTISC